MRETDEQRRSWLVGLSLLGLGSMLPSELAATQTEATPGQVVNPSEGEHLIHFRDQGNIYIKAGKATGSPTLAFGTQQVTRGAGIPEHRHPEMTEAFYVLSGSGTATLGEIPHALVQGSSILIPRNTWHAFHNSEEELLLLWTVTPAGLDQFFRETCSHPGEPPKNLTREQIKQIALTTGTEFR